MPFCLPIGLKTLCPTEMVSGDICHLYKHIILSQESPDQSPFKFTLANGVLTSLDSPETITKKHLFKTSSRSSFMSPMDSKLQGKLDGEDLGWKQNMVVAIRMRESKWQRRLK